MKYFLALLALVCASCAHQPIQVGPLPDTAAVRRSNVETQSHIKHTQAGIAETQAHAAKQATHDAKADAHITTVEEDLDRLLRK